VAEVPASARIKRIVALARPEARRLALGTFFLAVSSASMLAYPQAIRVILDEALGKRDLDALNQIAVAVLVVMLLQAVTSAARFYLFTTAGERVVTQLRRTLYERLVRQEIAFFDGRTTGELMSRLAADAGVLQNAVSVNVSMGLRHAATALGALALLFTISPRLSGIMLAVVPPVALGAVAYGRRVRKLSQRAQDALARAGHVAEETLGAIRTVRAFTREDAEAARYGAAVEASFDVSRERVRNMAVFIGSASAAGYGALALVVWYGGKLVVDGALTPGDLTSFLLYTLTLSFSLGALGDLFGDFMRAAGAADRVFELLDREPTIPLRGGAKLPAVRGRVTLEAVEFRYPSRADVPVLQGFDLVLEPGEVVALVGPSGSGKSTIAALLQRLYDPLAGRVTLDGADLRTLDPTFLRQQIGVVSQEPTLLSTSILENVRYGRPDATVDEVEAALVAANAADFVRRFPNGLATEVGERGVQLSGGQKQRVAIARALLKNPSILILDEATSALDAESEHLVQEALDRLQAGRTTLVIAHRLSTVKDADRVAVIEAGRVAQLGSHAELMAEEAGIYRRLVERQFVSA
jgi:ATP-binding cassette subfamily B protein